jgi:2,3-bisphosphoglycerate-independent phosphoglycerate mutase
LKYLFIIGDGMADRTVDALNGRTPLQAAFTPTLDRLAGQHMGQVQSIPEGYSAGTETAIPILLGYGTEVLTGRGAVEAAGMGLAMQDGQCALRMNLIKVNNDGRLTDACPDLRSGEGMRLGHLLQDNAAFASFLRRHNIVLHVQDSFRQLLTGDGSPPKTALPPHNMIGQALSDCLPDSCLRELMQIGAECLKSEKAANAVWPWGGGRMPQYQPFFEKTGLRAAVVTAVPMVKGLARLCRMEAIDVPGATGTLRTNWRGKAAAVAHALRGDFDFVLLHIEAPDDCSHALDIKGKIDAIEMVDAAAALIMENLSDMPLRILVCSDHLTLAENGRHTADPTPYCIYDTSGPAKPGSFAEGQGAVTAGHKPISLLLQRV